jgi:hypothetical protein
MRKIFVLGAFVSLGVVAAQAGCGDDDDGDGGVGGDGRPEDTGAACVAPADCYDTVLDRTTIKGEVVCMDRVRDGYCTHTCTADADCCAAEGECDAGFKEVCSPFESLEGDHCFLSCEPGDLVAAPGQTDPVEENEYCQRRAGKDFLCRSSGGGTENRKICVPADCGVGADCAGDADCGADLVCLTSFLGGYCGRQGCTTNAECPGESICVKEGSINYCYKPCTVESDCSVCRKSDLAAACRNDVSYVDTAATNPSVCVPPGI